MRKIKIFPHLSFPADELKRLIFFFFKSQIYSFKAKNNKTQVKYQKHKSQIQPDTNAGNIFISMLKIKSIIYLGTSEHAASI